MAQLTDDCFAFSGPLLPIADMERMIAERVQPVTETESVPLAAARGRVLAADVIAPLDLPPFDNSAVDGYAVRHRDLDAKAETRLAIGGRLTAGSATASPIGAGQAIRIFTGAPMPAGADTVFMQEDVRAEGDAVIVPAGLKAGANRRLAGEDVRKGSVVLPAGRRLAAQDVALAAAVGLTTLDVRRRVRVALFSTGDEIVEPGSAAAGRGALRRQPHPARRHARPPRRRGDRSRHHQGRSRRAGEGDCGCGARPRSGADLGRRLDRRSRSCAKRRGKDRTPGVLARRHQAGPAGGDGRDPRRERRTAARRSSACPAIRSRRS